MADTSALPLSLSSSGKTAVVYTSHPLEQPVAGTKRTRANRWQTRTQRNAADRSARTDMSRHLLRVRTTMSGLHASGALGVGIITVVVVSEQP